MNVRDLDVDFLTISAHKIYGPKGIGALYVKKGAPYCPLILGGHQEGGRRAGTENSLGIIGMGKAMELRALEMEDRGKASAETQEHPEGRHRRGHPRRALHGPPGALPAGHPERLLCRGRGRGHPLLPGPGRHRRVHGFGLRVGLPGPVPCHHGHGSARGERPRLGAHQPRAGKTPWKDVQYMLHHLPPIIDRIRTMSTAYRRK